jgi:hypothetical protein
MFANFKSDVYAEIRDTLRFADDDNAITLREINDTIQSAGSAVQLSGNIDLSLAELQMLNAIAVNVLRAAVTAAAAAAAAEGAPDFFATGGAFLASGKLDGLISKITEQTIAKPQRQRIINDYIMFTLQPEFKQNLADIGRGIIGNIETLLIESSRESAAEWQNNLQTLKAKKIGKVSEYRERIARLKTYKTALITSGSSEEMV